MGRIGVNAKRPMPMATASDAEPATAIIGAELGAKAERPSILCRGWEGDIAGTFIRRWRRRPETVRPEPITPAVAASGRRCPSAARGGNGSVAGALAAVDVQDL